MKLVNFNIVNLIDGACLVEREKCARAREIERIAKDTCIFFVHDDQNCNDRFNI